MVVNLPVVVNQPVAVNQIEEAVVEEEGGGESFNNQAPRIEETCHRKLRGVTFRVLHVDKIEEVEYQQEVAEVVAVAVGFR